MNSHLIKKELRIIIDPELPPETAGEGIRNGRRNAPAGTA